MAIDNISTTIELRHHFDIYLSSSSHESERSSDDSDDSTEEGYATFTSFLEQLRSQYRNSSTYDIDEEENEENRDAASNGFSLFSLQTDGDLPIKTTIDHSQNFSSYDSSKLELSDSDSIWGSYSDLLSMLSPQSNTNFNHSCSMGIPATGGN
ncbi:hypothetical protein BKA69DRAFT_1039914 [Paraphysoderma sedebokerense]|nr:hypothetical protein BKA69DRAFT_1039914 [Paraphysoderma sedebokerense]